MFFTLIFLASISACFATDPPITCGEMPAQMYSCLGNPRLIKREMTKNCGAEISECERLTCVFTNSGWLNDGKVEKSKVKVYFDQFARDYPQWSEAVRRTKEACLTTDLPMQGVHLNCPAYDIIFCALINFAQYAQPSQWSSEEACTYPKLYAAKCPVCPGECFGPLVPYGSCNACLGLPRQK